MKKSTKKKPSLKKLPKFGNAGTYNASDPNRSVDAFNEANSGTSTTGQVNYGDYAKIGSAALDTGVQLAANYNSPRPNTTSAYNSARGFEGAVVSTIAPAYGILHAATGKTVDFLSSKTNAGKTDASGNLVNRSITKQDQVGRAFADPFAELAARGSYKGGWTDFTGNAYADHVEEDAKNNIKENQIQQEQQQAQQDQYNKMVNYYNQNQKSQTMYAKYGGKMPRLMKYEFGGDNENPNAELEKQEVVQTPQGQIDNVNGPSHENGGVPVNIPEGTQILSDKLKMPGTKKTFAKLGKPLNTSKEEKVIDNPDSQSLAKSTANLMLQAKNNKLNQLFQIQEQLKKSKVAEYAQKMGVDLNSLTRPQKNDEQEAVDNPQEENQEYSSGGIHIKPSHRGRFTEYKQRTGKTTEEALHSSNPHVRQMANFARNASKWKHDYGGTQLPKYGGGATYTGGYDQRMPDDGLDYQRTQMEIDADKPNDKSQMMQDEDMKDFWAKTPADPNRKPPRYDYTNDIGNTVAGIANLAGPIYGLATNKREATVMPHLLNPKYINNSEELNSLMAEKRSNIKDLNDVAGGNQALYLANRQRIGTNYNKGVALSNQATQNANSAIYNRADEGNVNQRVYADDINRRNQAAYRNMNTKYVGDAGNILASNWKDQKATGMDQKSLVMISAMYPDYKYKNGVWIHKLYGTNLNDDIKNGKVKAVGE